MQSVSFRPILLKTFLALTLLFVFSRELNAQDYSHRFGLGVIFGEPTGFTGKYFINKNVGVNADLTYSFQDYFLTFIDGVYHFYPTVFERDPNFGVYGLSPYVGAGGGLRMTTKSKAKERHSVQGFFRFPLGLEWRPKSFPVGVFLELAPGMAFAPKVFGLIQGGIGARYYF